jgi:RNA polymerase sigma-70 factor (subfamily 1)
MSSPKEFKSCCPDFDQLLKAARDGDKDAQGRVLEILRRPLLRLARKQLSIRMQAKGGASDMVQDTLVKALYDFCNFKGYTIEELEAWLRSILMHTAANFAHQFTTQKRQIGREVSPVSEQVANDVRQAAPSASEVAARYENVCHIQEVIGRLPSRQAEVVRLHNEENLSFTEIGRRIGRSADAARKLWARSVAYLRRTLRTNHF